VKRARVLSALALCALTGQGCGDFPIEDFQYSVHASTSEFGQGPGTTNPAFVVVTVDLGDAHRSMVLGPGHLSDDVVGYSGADYRASAYVQTSDQLVPLRARRDAIEMVLGQADVLQGDLLTLQLELRDIASQIANYTKSTSCGAEFKEGSRRATVIASVQANGSIFMTCN
jgi:hypothetical protein